MSNQKKKGNKEENQQNKQQILQNNGSIKAQLDIASSLKPPSMDQYLPYDQLDLRNICNVKLTRTPDDDEFSQILKKDRQLKMPNSLGDSKNNLPNLKSKDQSIFLGMQDKLSKGTEKSGQFHLGFRSILKESDLNQVQSSSTKRETVTNNQQQKEDQIQQTLQDNQNFISNQFSAYPNLPEKAITNQQNANHHLQNIPLNQLKSSYYNSLQNSSKQQYAHVFNSSKGSSHNFFSPEFGNSELSFHNKKKNESLKRNLFFNEFDAEDLTLEQFSMYQFQRNPYLSQGKIQFEQSSTIKNAIPIEKCQNYQFLCEPCFEMANSLSQESIQSLGNGSTARKQSKKSQFNKDTDITNDLQSTLKKISPNNKVDKTNYFEQIKSYRPKLPCFCSSGVIGYQQFFQKLVEIHFSKTVEEKEVKNHFKYLVWKLSSLNKLSIESLYFHIEKRIYLTKILKIHPFLQQYLGYLKSQHEQKKAASTNNQQLQKQNVDNSKINNKTNKEHSSFPNQIVLLVGEITETSQYYIVEYTDTWSSLYQIVYKQLYQQKYNNYLSPHRKSLSLTCHQTATQVRESDVKNRLKLSNNQLFEDLLLRKQLKPFTKVRISNVSFSSEQKISIEIDHIKKEYNNLININFNSFQKETNESAKLGYLNKPFLRTLSSIKPQGGFIPTLDLIILKRYPLLVQYFQSPSNKIITYSEAVNSSIVNKSNPNDYFFAKYLVCDSFFIYDKSSSISSQPQTELIIQFNDPHQYNSLTQGQRMRLRNVSCDNFDVQAHYSSGYKISLRVHAQNVMHQERFLMKSDFQKSLQFYQGAAKAFTQSKVIEDFPSCSNLNYLEALDFDIKISYRSLSPNNNNIIGELKYFTETYECEIVTHNSLFKTKLLSAQKYQIIQLKNVHFKSMNAQKKKFIFKTSFNTFIDIQNP